MGGTSLCVHKLKRSLCSAEICGGGTSLCKHGIRRGYCKDALCYGGTYLCQCGNYKEKDGYCTRCHPDYVETGSQCSKAACAYLDALAVHLGYAIQHKHVDVTLKKVVGNEHRPAGWKQKPVDGYFQDEDGTHVAIEFLGNIYHGHPSLWPKGTNHFGQQYTDLHAKTERTLRKLRALGYRVFYVWEHDYTALKGLDSVRTILREFEDKLES